MIWVSRFRIDVVPEAFRGLYIIREDLLNKRKIIKPGGISKIKKLKGPLFY